MLDLSEEVLYQDESGYKLVRKFSPPNTWRLFAKDIVGKYYNGEILNRLVRKAEAQGINVYSATKRFNNLDAHNVLRKFLRTKNYSKGLK